MIQQTNDIILADNLDELIAREDMDAHKSAVVMLYCRQGGMQVDLNNRNCQIRENDLLICLPQFLVGHYMRTPDFECSVLCVTRNFLRDIAMDCLRNDPKWLEKQQFIDRHPIISLDTFQKDLLDSYFRLLQVYLRGEQDTYRRQILRAVAQAATLEIMSYIDTVVVEDGLPADAQLTRKDNIMRGFIDLLRRPENTHREVQWFADKLCITPKYLSEVSKERSGKTASEWITEFTLEQIRHYLQHSSMTIKEVAFQLGFTDTSFFCQYVRKHMGMTPRQLRFAE